MTRKYFLLTVLLCVSASILARAVSSDELIPAGTLLQCTLDEPNFSSKTAQVGDPVLCYLGHISAFGRSIFPRGAELSGHLQDYQNPGHFVGKGWIEIDFDRIILPGAQVYPLSAKVISAPHLKVDAEGKVHSKGHPKRDAALWAVPVFWPVKILTLPNRGPYPAFKGEARLTLRLLEDIEVPLSASNARASVPMPPWVSPSRYDASSSVIYSPASLAPRGQTATLQPASFVQRQAERAAGRAPGIAARRAPSDGHRSQGRRRLAGSGLLGRSGAAPLLEFRRRAEVGCARVDGSIPNRSCEPGTTCRVRPTLERS